VLLLLAGFVAPATILVVLALGLNLQWGHTGLFNAGVAAFVGVGAYVFAMFATGGVPAGAFGSTYPGHWGLAGPIDLVLAAFLAMLAAGVLGVLIAIPTLRLRADYLAIATLALGEIARLVLKNERSVTGGDQTLPLIPRPFDAFVPRGPYSDAVFSLIAIGVALGALFVLDFLTRAPWGRNLRAIREDEEAAMALGKDAFTLKLSSFGIGCAIMGLSGALLASFNGVITPDQFAPAATFSAYVVVILGGSGNNRGVILGGYLFFLFTWTTQQLKGYLPSDVNLRLDYVNQIAIGLLLILFILFRPEGVMPEPKYLPRRKA